MNKKLVAVSALATLLTLPVFIWAITIPPAPSPSRAAPSIIVIGAINKIFDIIWPAFGAFAVIMFVVAGFLFLTANGETGKLSSARNALIWGAVGVAVALLSSTIPYIVASLVGL